MQSTFGIVLLSIDGGQPLSDPPGMASFGDICRGTSLLGKPEPDDRAHSGGVSLSVNPHLITIVLELAITLFAGLVSLSVLAGSTCAMM